MQVSSKDIRDLSAIWVRFEIKFYLDGKIDQPYDYLKKKRKKYIKSSEKMYNQGYEDKKEKSLR